MRRLLILGCCAALMVVGCGAEEAKDSKEQQEDLESFWKDPGKADLVAFGTMFESDYTNMGASGRATAGDVTVDFALFAGWHTDDFPWPDARNWASIGFKWGDEGYSYVAYEQTGFSITSLPDERGAVPWSLHFDGFMEAASTGDLVPVEISLTVTAAAMDEWQIGFLNLGMGYRPALLSPQPGVTNADNTFIKIDGVVYPIDQSTFMGEVEQGHVLGVNYRGAFYKYDYCSLSNPDEGKSFTSFTTRTLSQEGSSVLQKASDLLSSLGSKAFTFDRNRDYSSADNPCIGECEPDWKFDPGAFNPDNPEGVVCPAYGPEGVIFEHVVDLGTHGSLKRQMFRSATTKGEEYVGLREVFLPKTNVWGGDCEPVYCGDLPDSE